MRTRTLRTIGAVVVLLGLTIAGVAQIRETGDRVEIVDDTAPATTHRGVLESTTIVSEPFIYRVGVLSGVTTDNFWAFYGEQPSAWNSYILGPTKPALFTANVSLGTLEPELAASAVDPTLGDDGWAVQVELNPNLKWSDGVPVTADDLVFTFETVRALDLRGSWAEAFPTIVEAVDADDDHRVRIGFSERPQLSVWPHGVGLAPIMARHVWEPLVEGTTADELYEMSGADDLSGGPLAIAAISESLILSNTNPGYPLASTPDTIEYHVYDDEPAAVAALAAGEVDSVLSPRGLTDEHLATIEADPGVRVVNSPGNGIRYLGFNLSREPMVDQEFRTALALLLERGSLADSIPQTGQPAWALVPEANTEWFDADAAAESAGLYHGPLEERLTTALEGLSSAGYAWEAAPSVDDDGNLVSGTGLTINGQTPQVLTILTTGDEYDRARPDYVNEIATTLGILGFDARSVETDFDTVVDLAFTPSEDGELHFDMYMLGWTLGNPALPGYYGALFASGGPMNNTGYESAAFTEALEAYEGAFTTDQAFNALWDMERALAVDLPYLLLYTSEITEAYRSDRVAFDLEGSLGGLQARLGGIQDVRPAD